MLEYWAARRMDFQIYNPMDHEKARKTLFQRVKTGMFKNSMAVSHSEEFAVGLFVFTYFLFIFLFKNLGQLSLLTAAPPEQLMH